LSLYNSFISADAFPTEDASHFYFIIVTYVSGYFTLLLLDVTDRMLSEGWPKRGLVVVVEKGKIQTV